MPTDRSREEILATIRLTLPSANLRVFPSLCQSSLHRGIGHLTISPSDFQKLTPTQITAISSPDGLLIPTPTVKRPFIIHPYQVNMKSNPNNQVLHIPSSPQIRQIKPQITEEELQTKFAQLQACEEELLQSTADLQTLEKELQQKAAQLHLNENEFQQKDAQLKLKEQEIRQKVTDRVSSVRQLSHRCPGPALCWQGLGTRS